MSGITGAEIACTKYKNRADLFRANCYAFAINHICKDYGKLQPGQLSGVYKNSNSIRNCESVTTRLESDLQKLGFRRLKDAGCKCPPGFYKICLLLNPHEDYHFLRQSGDVLYPAEENESIAKIAKKFRVPIGNVKPVSRRRGVFRIKNSGVWCHKRGFSEVTLLDAKGKLIFDPRKSSFNYGRLNYNKLCRFYCVKSRRRRVTVK